MATASQAGGQTAAKQYYDAGVITIGGNAQSFTIGKGENIRFTAGQSIRLLPGTRIEAGGQVVVEVGATAQAESTEKRRSALLDPEFLAVPYLYVKESSFSSRPDPGKLIASTGLVNAVIPVQSSGTSKQFPVKKIYYYFPTDESCSGLSFLNHYLPVLTWGERPETIKVMRT